MLGLMCLQCVGSLLELVTEIDELSVTKFCSTFEISIPLGAIGCFPRSLEAFLEFLEPRDEFLFLLPLGFEARDLLLEPAELLFDGGAPLL